MTIGQRIQKARKEKELTQKELAAKLGLATGTIQQYELDKRQPRLEQLQRIADTLGVSGDYLLNGWSVRTTHIAGLHIYRVASPYGVVTLDVLQDFPEGSYNILHQDKQTLIVADADCPLSKEQMVQIVKVHTDKNLHIADEDRDIVVMGLTLPPLEELSDNLNALKSVMNASGYDLIKVHGEFCLTGKRGGHLLTEKQVLDLLNSSIQYVGYMCSRIEDERIRGSFGLIDPPQQPPDAPVGPQEGTDTIPPPEDG